jgi:class 3 adenylate cyclase
MSSADVLVEVKEIFRKTWTRTPARDVPAIEALALSGNQGVELDGTVLYADMADSTALVNSYRDEFAAEVYRAYLLAACRVIKVTGGEITAFDGDRVMAVFVGDNKNSAAAKCGLHMNAMVRGINAAIKSQYPNTAFTLAHCVGVDTSPLFVTKTGVRKYNDLVWVGAAANYAAKLSAMNDPGYPTLVTERVYNLLNDKSKFGGTPRSNMWEKSNWPATGQTIYRSSYYWDF